MTDFALSSEESQALTEIPPIPWDALNSAEHRRTLLMDTEPFSTFKSLDPCRMSTTEMYDILNLITNAQEEEHYLLEFNVNDKIVKDLISSYTADLDDIVEVSDSSSTAGAKKSAENNRAKRRKNLILNTDRDSESISDGSFSSHGVPDFSPPLKINLNEFSHTLSPVVATPTFPTEQVESLQLEDHAVDTTPTFPSHNSSMPFDLTKATAVPSSPNLQSGQKRPRIDSTEKCNPKEPSDQAQKRVRLAEPEQPNLNTLTSESPAQAAATGISTPITKAKAPRGATGKRGRARGLRAGATSS